ncbi:MAG TPA: DUF554 domain-containing protein [Symbiobacteriaceae bacterium]
MIGLGTLANVSTVVLGGTLGSFVLPRIPERVSQTTIQALGLGVVLMGLQMAWGTEHLLLVLVSLAIGTVMGELMRIEDRLNRFAQKLEQLPFAGKGEFSKGFVQATLLFCVGAMAIQGALQDGLRHDPSLLYVKSVLDGISSVMLSSVMGPGVILSAVPILLYQGAMTLGASALSKVLTDALIQEIGAAGGLMVMGIGLNLAAGTQIRVANMLPALVVVPVLAALAGAYL